MGRATPLVNRVSKCLMLGLSNEVYNLSVAQVVQEKLGKVRRTFVYWADLFWPQCI